MSGKELESELDDRLLHRFMFFTDAVFAIVMTLLVLELRPPHVESAQDLADGLTLMMPAFLAFALSFAVTGIFWVAHLTYSRRMLHFDWQVAWLNLLFLLIIALVPFGAALLGEHYNNSSAWTLYSGIMILSGVTQSILWLAISRDGGHLIGGIKPNERLLRTLRGLTPTFAFSCAFALIQFGRVDLAYWCGLLIPVFYFMIGRILPLSSENRSAET